MKLTKEQIAEILYKSCEENDADIGSINFDAILDGLNKHLNEYLGQSLPIDSVSGRFYSDTEIAILKEECYQDGIEEGEMNV